MRRLCTNKTINRPPLIFSSWDDSWTATRPPPRSAHRVPSRPASYIALRGIVGNQSGVGAAPPTTRAPLSDSVSASSISHRPPRVRRHPRASPGLEDRKGRLRRHVRRGHLCKRHDRWPRRCAKVHYFLRNAADAEPRLRWLLLAGEQRSSSHPHHLHGAKIRGPRPGLRRIRRVLLRP